MVETFENIKKKKKNLTNQRHISCYKNPKTEKN